MTRQTVGRGLLLVALPALLTCASGALAGDGPDPNVFTGSNGRGQAWVSVRLARLRTDQSFTPFLVAVRNTGRAPVTLERSSFRVVAADGEVVPMATVREIREGYPMLLFDQTAVRFTGLPLGTVLDLSSLEPSNFFPTAVGPGQAPVSTGVTLAPGEWTVDLLYFPRPPGLAEEGTVTFEIQGTGWKRPIRIPIHL